MRADHTSAEGMLSGVRKGVEAGVMVRAGSFASASVVEDYVQQGAVDLEAALDASRVVDEA